MKLAPLAGAATAAGAAVAIALAQPSAGPLALARWLAETIAAHGIPPGAASLGWLGALGLHALEPFGPLAATIVSVSGALAALALVERRARILGAAGTVAALAVPLAALCMLDALRPGGGASSWAFAAAFAFVLDGAPLAARAVLLAAVTVAWCNVAPQGLLAPALALASAAGAALDEPRAAATRGRWVECALCCLGTFATPAGLAFPAAAFEALRLGSATDGIASVVPAATAPHAYHAGLYLLLIGAFATGVRSGGLRTALPVTLAFVLALANGAFVPLFGVIAAPVVAAGLRTARFGAFVVPAASLAALVAIGAFARIAPQGRGPAHPFELAERATEGAGPRDALFCANVDWCDVALENGERVVMDGRIATAGAPVRATQRTIAGVRRGWQGALAKSGATSVLAANDSPLATLLAMSGAWHGVASDDRATLFERIPNAAGP